MGLIRICVAGRNHAALTERCIGSILTQSNAGCFLDWTDDCSDTEDAWKIAERMTSRAPCLSRVERTPGRRGGLENFWRAIQRANDDDILVIVGGDDWIEPHALYVITSEYRDPDCWLTYGQMQNVGEDGSSVGPKHFRADLWDGSDPRTQTFLWSPLTVRAKLAKKIHEADLKMGGWFFPSGGDVALNIPLVEMAGPDHARFIGDPWYNRFIHEGNDHNASRKLQDFCGWMALCKPRYSRLESLDDPPVRTEHLLPSSIIFAPQLAEGRAVVT